MKWQAVFFDFDGVILDSVDVKTQAFAKMFRPYGKLVEKAVIEYHLTNGGVSRYKKFEHYYRNILKKPIDENTLEVLGKEFNSVAIDGVMKAPFIDGALDTLKKLKCNNIPAFVASGTPDEELQMIVERRNLSQYFCEVHGSPRKKEKIVMDIAVRYSFQTKNCLFIGDSITDYEAASLSGTKFLGIIREDNVLIFPDGTNVSRNVKL